MEQNRMPMDTCLQIMQDSLEKKLDLLARIEDKSKEQESILKRESFSLKELDENMESKAKMIEELALLDGGFESLYEKIREELLENKELYRIQIDEIQNLIVEVTARGASIEAIEARNKTAVENFFSREKMTVQRTKNAASVAKSYYRTAKSTPKEYTQFLDVKN